MQPLAVIRRLFNVKRVRWTKVKKLMTTSWFVSFLMCKFKDRVKSIQLFQKCFNCFFYFLYKGKKYRRCILAIVFLWFKEFTFHLVHKYTSKWRGKFSSYSCTKNLFLKFGVKLEIITFYNKFSHIHQICQWNFLNLSLFQIFMQCFKKRNIEINGV